MTRRVVQFSGGVTSWAAAMRVAEQHGTKDLILLFADVLTEDPDVYRFLTDSSHQLGVPLTRVCDGRTPWQAFHDVRYLGNSRFAPCTLHLKIKPCRAWLSQHADPAETILYVGLDASPRDRARAPGIAAGWQPWTVRFPMLETPPYLTKADQLAWCRSVGVEPPTMYRDGYVHANCGGACVRAGQRQWLHLLRTHPDRYAHAERQERELRRRLGDVAILRERRGGASRPLTLTALRERHTAPPCRGQDAA